MHGEMAAMDMPLLPMWLRIVWVVALLAVMAVHTGHLVVLSGQHRAWHTGHTVMAAGMALMYLLPRMQHPELYRAGLVLFALVALVQAVITVAFRAREGAVNPLWLLATVDMLAMVYMLLPPTTRPDWLNWVFVAYLACQTVAYGLGAWDRLPVFTSRTPTSVTAGVATTEHAREHEHAVTPLSAEPAPDPTAGPVVGLVAHSSLGVRVTLAVMAASMAYMLAVM
ncbi:hypothetical protein SAMN04487905_1088 [Actinopolyspora xinjiangensis]|uniref:DUF5134 domain-containing protein n=1 Tax=Actinopolyspora xinjiangensis TaxID=405564 RepID=A0A1H0V5I7_9ACTN|nr:DUF5134 domain-containing protein [Actinopolyspora xinjiangensis]SDP73458.1 hypothetical protein SAMN04487905_1088 [Actinopolyspora xinjiangensis]